MILKRSYSIAILPRRGVWDHKTILTPPLFIEMPLPGQQCEQSCLYVLWIPLFQILDSVSLFVFSFIILKYFHDKHISSDTMN